MIRLQFFLNLGYQIMCQPMQSAISQDPTFHPYLPVEVLADPLSSGLRAPANRPLSFALRSCVCFRVIALICTAWKQVSSALSASKKGYSS